MEKTLDNHRIGVTKIRPIITDTQKHFLALSRVQVRPVDSEKPLCVPEIVDRVMAKVRESKSVLCILNTKSNAKAIFKELTKNKKCGGQSVAPLNQHVSSASKGCYRNCQTAGLYCRKTGTKAPVVISTQLVEAGVNLDLMLYSGPWQESILLLRQRVGAIGKARCLTLGEVYYFKAGRGSP